MPLLFGPNLPTQCLLRGTALTAVLVNRFGVTTVNFIYSTGKIGFLLISNGLGLAGTIMLGFLLVPHFGLMGAAWSRAVVQVSSSRLRSVCHQ